MKARYLFFLFYFLSIHSVAGICTKCRQETAQDNWFCDSCILADQMSANKQPLDTVPDSFFRVQQQPSYMKPPQIHKSKLRKTRREWLRKYKEARSEKDKTLMKELYLIAESFPRDIWFTIQKHIILDYLYDIDCLQGLLDIKGKYLAIMDDYTLCALYHSIAFSYYLRKEYDESLLYYMRVYTGNRPVPKKDFKNIKSAYKKISKENKINYQIWVGKLTSQK
ncbi:hypothetical protein [Candidatus Sororendozoicomonas aggregata]|uniref:hypothetical protein n=1 Tax=Candidatus Sororendozoicomonas aggregata TaxID=3073239 RepID=UPI002ED4A8AA